jgi:uncharacterized membrane protein
MTIMAWAVSLHLLASLIWVGGMFFAHMVLRPELEGRLAPAQRLPLMHGVLTRFFRWVWLAVATILGSGYGVYLGVYGGRTGLYVHLMQGTGLLMIGLFVWIYFVPFRHMGMALQQGDLAAAGAKLKTIRGIITVNLLLGLLTSVMGAGGRYW